MYFCLNDNKHILLLKAFDHMDDDDSGYISKEVSAFHTSFSR